MLSKKKRYFKSQHARSGTHLSKIRGRGMDFSEVRNYQAGDEIRHMQWRITAKTGKPHIKVYQEERERPVMLLVDFNPSMIFGTRVAFKSVTAARLAALIAWAVVSGADKIGGLFFSAAQHSELVARGRDFGALPLLASLSYYTHHAKEQGLAKPRQLSEVLARMRRVVRPGSLIVLISDFYTFDTECTRLLTYLRAHNDLLAYHICDPLEYQSPPPERYGITNGTSQLLLNTESASVAEAYTLLGQTRKDYLQEQFKKVRTPYVQVFTDAPILEILSHSFPGSIRG